MPVHDLRCAGAGVPSQAGDLFDGHSAIRHEADKRVPKLAWSPVLADTGRLAGCPEIALDVGGVQGSAHLAGEDEASVTPAIPGRDPFPGLPGPMSEESVHGYLRQPERAARLGCLRVSPGPYGAPYSHVRRHRRIGIGVAGQVDVIPAQFAGLLGPDAGR